MVVTLTGLEKIIKEIMDEAMDEGEEIVSAATAEAGRILDKAKAESEKEVEEIRSAARIEVMDVERARDSTIELQRRQVTLRTKQEILNETLDAVMDRLRKFPDDEYFKLIIKLAAQSAAQGEGTLYFGRGDIARLPADFEKSLNEAIGDGCTLKISTEARNIDGGVILAYGGIEENCSFEAVFNARRDEFMDIISEILFA